jgi:uncharacterized protein (TIGR03435 family)
VENIAVAQRLIRSFLSVAFVVCSSINLYGQAAFEVATIKPAAPQAIGRTSVRMSSDTSTGLLNYTNVNLRDVLKAAYTVQGYQITGLDWIDSDRFDFAAKFTPETNRDQIPKMLQALLAERFGVMIHRETKELPVYTLMVAKGGAKLTASKTDGSTSTNSSGAVWHLTGTFTMRRLADFLSERTSRPVLDQTDLSGSFEIKLDWTEDNAATQVDGTPPSLITALQEQLGLKLNSTKGPVETIVIDRANRSPSDN